MKKHLVRILSIFLVCLVLVGCGKKQKQEEQEKIADDEVILENIKYKLDQDDTGYGISYKVASNFRKTELINAINYYSENINGSTYFVIRISHYKNKSIDYAIKDCTEGIEYTKIPDIKINDLDYTPITFVNAAGAESTIYYHKHNKDVYAFLFASKVDISRLEDIFLKSIVY